MPDDKDKRTPEQKKLDATVANIQDMTDALRDLEEVSRYVALRLQLLADPYFLVRPTPIRWFSYN